MTGIVNSTGARSGVVGTTVGTPSGGGKVLQVIQTVVTASSTTSSSSTSSFVDVPGLTVNITPASSNKVLVSVSLAASRSTGTMHCLLMRDSTAIGIGDADYGNQLRSTFISRYNYWEGFQYGMDNHSFQFLDSPSADGSTAVTYKLQWTLGSSYSGSLYLNRSGERSNYDYSPLGASSITVMEIDV